MKVLEGDIPKRNLLGTAIRKARTKSLEETAKQIDQLLDGDGSFTHVVLADIERSVRSSNMKEMEAISSVLNISLESLKDYAIAWNDALWDDEEKKKLTLDQAYTETKTTSIIGIDPAQTLDELVSVRSDLVRGSIALEEAEAALWARDSVLAQRIGHTARLLRASYDRLGGLLSPGVQAVCEANGEDEG